MRNQRVGLRDVAAAAGVSVTTASDALNGRGRLTDATRLRVREVAQSLGYGPNAMARSLVGARTDLVALALSYAEDDAIALTEVDYIRQAILAATARAQQLDRGLMMGPPTRHPEMWLRLPMDGLIVLSPVRRDPLLRIMREVGTPIVVVGRAPDEPGIYPCVDNDHVSGTEVVLDHLAERGARRIGLVVPQLDDAFTDDCVAGYRGWSRAHGGEEGILWLPALPLGRRSQIEELLRSDNRPDAIHTTVWEVGLEVARIADRLGIRVPDDLLISTCGDSEPEPGTIGLTSLKLHPGAAATAAFDVLVEWLESGERPADREIPAQLVIRESTTRG